jgi:TatA/E family protein of Tat protein translocase
MALDDPIVWVLIVVVVLILFGASRIPKFARALGEARAEFTKGSQGGSQQAAPPPPAPGMVAPPPPTSSQTVSLAPDDPLYAAAEKEGIDMRGKSKSEIASELAWKLSKKQQ